MGLESNNCDVLERVMEAQLAEEVSNATVYRTMEVVRSILRMAANE
ncbi:MAG: hypothetical protein R3284_08190 [Rubricoccaceae bacterium]|nr:hypothetical protein [Rubricoccaceae bacterium]